MVVYKPDIVGVGRLFMVALEVPPETGPLTLTVPASVELLDRTPLPVSGKLRKYYFRAAAAAESAPIVFSGTVERIEIPVVIWSFEQLREFRKLKNVRLPRRWPLGERLPELKQSQTVTTPEEKARRSGHSGSSRYLRMSDEQIWALQPDTTLPRWHWTNVQEGCPRHGTEIYRRRAFYPWLNEKGKELRSYTAGVPYPWKIMCPVGRELYPSNDFAAGDFTGGAFPDDGFGGSCEYEGKRYGFVAEINQAYCHQMLAVAPSCAGDYLATGDIRYVHKALVALCRLAVEYAYLATMTQHRHRNSRGQVERLGPAPFREGPFLSGAGFTVYCIDQPGYQWRTAEAYDRIWPAIDQDREIIPFLQGKGFEITSHEDVRRFIEENLMAVWMQGAMDGATASNEPYAQRGLVRMAEVLNYRRGDEFMDWLYDGRGNMRVFVPNGFFRDGAPYESTGGYNGMHVVALGPIVDSIEHLRQLRPDVYPTEKYPDFTKSRRYRSVFDFSMNTVNIDRTFPKVGDTGGIPAYARNPRITWQNGGALAFEHAYRTFKDPKFAWALAKSPSWRPSEEFDYTREQIERAAAEWPDNWNDSCRLSDGYGLAMLRSGKGIGKRALWMMFGRAKGHVHDDMLHVGLDAFGSEILGHLGYPRNWNSWSKNWITQNVARQIPFRSMTGTAELFCEVGPVHLAEARARAFEDEVAAGEGYRPDPENWQRRMLAIVDLDEDTFYCIDLHRIFGGSEAWWSFHCQEDEGFATSGLDLVRQQGGTVAGKDVPYGDESWLLANGCRRNRYGFSGNRYGFAHLYNVQRAKTAGVWSADWALKGADGLHFRLTSVPSGPYEAIVCDGTSPAGGKPYEMKWLLLHNQGTAPLRTQVASFLELYRREPVIRSVRPLVLSGGDEAGFEAYGFRVDLGRRTDYVFASAQVGSVRTAEGGFEFSGRFGLLSEVDGELSRVVLVGGTLLTRNGVGVNLEQPELRASIAAVDRQAGRITLDRSIGDPDGLVGQVVFVHNADRRIGLTVRAAATRRGRTVLSLEFDPFIGTGRVTGVGPRRILTDTPFHVSGHRYYHGARILNEAGDLELRVAGVRSGQFVLLGPSEGLSGARDPATGFPVGSWFRIYDYGVGDQVSWPQSISLRLQP